MLDSTDLSLASITPYKVKIKEVNVIPGGSAAPAKNGSTTNATKGSCSLMSSLT